MNSSPSSSNSVELDTTKLPAHVAIIMDGNGRWAKKRLLNRINGHEKGSETVRTIVRTCRQIGISYLTLYAFSTENWQRPKTEVEALMALLRKFSPIRTKGDGGEQYPAAGDRSVRPITGKSSGSVGSEP